MTALAIEQAPSPNYGPRTGGPVNMLILHYTGMDPAERALKWLRDPESSVSCHYFVFEDGRTLQLVDEADRAWHAGKSFWAGETDINSRSIGIEISNPGHQYGYRAFPDAQIEAVIAICSDILGRLPIPPERVLAHSDIAPLRKEDPGELFPWDRLHAEGIGHWVAPEAVAGGEALRPGDRGAAVAGLKKRFREYGYGLGEDSEFDIETEAVVRAFQRHFRQERIDGTADRSTVVTLERLLAALPPKA